MDKISIKKDRIGILVDEEGIVRGVLHGRGEEISYTGLIVSILETEYPDSSVELESVTYNKGPMNWSIEVSMKESTEDESMNFEFILQESCIY